MDNVRTQVEALAVKAKEASASLLQASEEMRNDALSAMAEKLRRRSEDIVAANAEDMKAARADGVTDALLDRLMLDGSRVQDMACALEDLMSLPDPLDKVLEESTLYNGMEMKRISVPLGVVAMVYEARPNVTADAAGICIKSGNSCILRGGSMAMRSNTAIAAALREGLEECGLPADCIVSIPISDRSATDALMQLHGIVDVLIPRGGAGLIRHCVEYSKVPVIETGTGNCHVFVHGSADVDMAENIAVNSKCRRYGVCNAAETLLLDKAVPDEVSSRILSALADKGVTIHADDRAYSLARNAGIPEGLLMHADEEDWGTEYLGPEISVKFVENTDEAIAHINRYGTKHSEAIVCQDEADAADFLKRVDAAAVYWNAATSFTDGGQFGLGAEIGISTQKLHARGPFALDALTSYKYVLRGSGQVRS